MFMLLSRLKVLASLCRSNLISWKHFGMVLCRDMERKVPLAGINGLQQREKCHFILCIMQVWLLYGWL